MSRSGSYRPDWLPVEVEWLPAAAGGRRTGPPAGPVYTPTARFADEALDQAFSVGVRFQPEDTASGTHPAELAMLFPENLPDKWAQLVPGAQLVLLEGARAVGRATVVTADRLTPATS